MARRDRVVGPGEVTCLACGWVAYAVTRSEAESEVASMRAYLATLSATDRRGWAPENPSVASYVCQKCGGSSFRPSQAGDCSDGVTVNPVVWEGDP